MQCVYCGRNNSDFARTCSKCGRILSKYEVSSVSNIPVADSIESRQRGINSGSRVLNKEQKNKEAETSRKIEPDSKHSYSQETIVDDKPNISTKEINDKASTLISITKDKTQDIYSYAQKSIKDLSASGKTESYSYTEHEYQKLGGWLAFFAYSLLVGVFLIAAIVIFALISSLRLSKYIGSWAMFLALISVIAYGPIIFFCYKMHVMVKNKNPLFLRFYEITMIIMVIITVLGVLVSNTQKVSDLIRALLEGGIIFFAWTTYFRKSVRVRTYFGSDEYLKKSIFFKNCEAPQPANIVYNNEEKIDE